MEAIQAVIDQAAVHNVPLLLNPGPCVKFPLEWLKYVTYIPPNKVEAKGLTGVEVEGETSAQKGVYLSKKNQAENCFQVFMCMQ